MHLFKGAMTDSERIPVIIGVGQINDRPEDPDNGLDPLGLMVEALKRAEADTGVTLLKKLDSIAVVDQISFRHLNPLDAKLAEALGLDATQFVHCRQVHGTGVAVVMTLTIIMVLAGPSMRSQAVSTLEMRSREGIGNSVSFKVAIISSFPAPIGAAPMSKLKSAFDAAVADSKTLDERPDNQTLLRIYGLFKQASEGDATGKRPGFTDLVGRAKYDAWAAVEGTSAEEAEADYIAKVRALLAAEK